MTPPQEEYSPNNYRYASNPNLNDDSNEISFRSDQNESPINKQNNYIYHNYYQPQHQYVHDYNYNYGYNNQKIQQPHQINNNNEQIKRWKHFESIKNEINKKK